MIKKTITVELFDLQTKNSGLPLKEKLLNQIKEDDETIEKVNKNNIAFAKGIMPLFFNYIKILSEKIDPDLNKKRIYFKFKNLVTKNDPSISFQPSRSHVNNFAILYEYTLNDFWFTSLYQAIFKF